MRKKKDQNEVYQVAFRAALHRRAQDSDGEWTVVFRAASEEDLRGLSRLFGECEVWVLVAGEKPHTPVSFRATIVRRAQNKEGAWAITLRAPMCETDAVEDLGPLFGAPVLVVVAEMTLEEREAL